MSHRQKQLVTVDFLFENMLDVKTMIMSSKYLTFWGPFKHHCPLEDTFREMMRRIEVLKSVIVVLFISYSALTLPSFRHGKSLFPLLPNLQFLYKIHKSSDKKLWFLGLGGLYLIWNLFHNFKYKTDNNFVKNDLFGEFWG